MPHLPGVHRLVKFTPDRVPQNRRQSSHRFGKFTGAKPEQCRTQAELFDSRRFVFGLFHSHFFLREMERGENANGQKFRQVREPSRRLYFQ
jgi:hypothetical protein